MPADTAGKLSSPLPAARLFGPEDDAPEEQRKVPQQLARALPGGALGSALKLASPMPADLSGAKVNAPATAHAAPPGAASAGLFGQATTLPAGVAAAAAAVSPARGPVKPPPRSPPATIRVMAAGNAVAELAKMAEAAESIIGMGVKYTGELQVHVDAVCAKDNAIRGDADEMDRLQEHIDHIERVHETLRTHLEQVESEQQQTQERLLHLLSTSEVRVQECESLHRDAKQNILEDIHNLRAALSAM